MLEFFTGDKIFESFIFQMLLYLPGAFVFYLIMKIKPLHRLLSKPIDLGKTLGGQRIFGDNKTWRTPASLFFGVLIGYGLAQPFIEKYDYMFDYLKILKDANLLLVVILLSFGSEIGELVNSFIKRRLGKKPGEQGTIIQYFFDQVDLFVAGCIFLSIFVKPVPFYFFAWGLIQAIALHSFYTYVVKDILGLYPKRRNKWR